MLQGGYIAKKETAALDLILISAGSELQHAMKAAETLGPGTRVVSMPCFERFDRQPADVSGGGVAKILPSPGGDRGFSVPMTWAPYVGLDGAVIGINRFGLSAPGGTVMKELGITAEHVIEAARALP